MKKHLAFALPLLAATALSGCGVDPAELKTRAQQSFAAQDYNAARIDLSAALREDPNNIAMLTMLAEAQLRLGDPDGVETTVGRLRRAGAQGPDVARMEAEMHLLRGKPDKALAALGNDTTTDGWRLRAEALLADKQTGKAGDAFEQGMAAGDDLRLAASYARFLLVDGQVDKVGKVLDRMRRMAPGSYEAMVLEGDLAAANGRSDAAMAAFRAVSDKYPHRIEPLLGMANQLDMLGKLDEAKAVMKRAAEVSPGDARLLALNVQFLAEEGEWQKVRDALQGSEASLEPTSANGMTYAEALLRLGQAEQARTYFSRAVLLAPQNRYARMMLGEAELESGDAAAAWNVIAPLLRSVVPQPVELELAEKVARAGGRPEAEAIAARRASPEYKAASALSGQGQGAMVRRDWATAIDAYTRLSQLGPDSEVLRRLAVSLSEVGRYDEAIAYADQANRLDPSNPDMPFVAGHIRLKAGRDLAEAERLLRAATRSSPSNALFKAELEKAKAAAS